MTLIHAKNKYYYNQKTKKASLLDVAVNFHMRKSQLSGNVSLTQRARQLQARKCQAREFNICKTNWY